MKQLLWITAALAALVAGCAGNPLKTDNESARHVAGATAGGAIGVGLTAALRAPAPLVVSGGIWGAALGYYATTLRFDGGPIYAAGGSIYTQGQYLGINIPSYKLFEANTANFTPQAEGLLNSAVAVLSRYPDSNVMITASTSGFGMHKADEELSQERARKIASYMWAHGVNNYKNLSTSTRKLDFAGYGDHFPIGSDLKVANLQKNGRVQITAYPSAKDLKMDEKSQIYKNIGETMFDEQQASSVNP